MESAQLGLPKKVHIRDGTEVLIRAVDPRDGGRLLRFFRGQPEEDRMYLRHDVTKQAWIDGFMRKLELRTIVPVLAERNSDVVGNATLFRQSSGWSAHVGEIRVSVARGIQGQGLSKLLLEPLVRAGVSLGLEQLIAHFVDDQVAARRLLQRLGFEHSATLPGRIKDLHGRRHDLIVMCNEISHVWDAMEDLVADFSPMRGWRG